MANLDGPVFKAASCIKSTFNPAYQLCNVMDSTEAAILIVIKDLVFWNESNSCHVGRSDGFDFVQSSETILANQL